jgi:lipopolysaccharide/colanic/teichoic acid biosynthesis glycosyltransferase
MATNSAKIPIAAGLTPFNRMLKRSFDVFVAVTGLCLAWWIIALAFAAASIDTGKSGFFLQERVGRNGRLFQIIKIRTMRDIPLLLTTVTCAGDPRITALGRFFRRTKIDELPQLVNVLLGQMSIVGPRPDVPGFADQLRGADRIVLSVRPGLTGPATLKFGREEAILAAQPDPEAYNREVIFPEKVRLNRAYVEAYSFWADLKWIGRSIWEIRDWGL